MSVINELGSMLDLRKELSEYKKSREIIKYFENAGYARDILKSGLDSKQLYATLKSSDTQKNISDYIINTYQRTIKKQSPTFSSQSLPFLPQLNSKLKQKGINYLYKHQQEAIDALKLGKNIVLTTETASGKSFVYMLPFLEEVLKDPNSTGLFIYPMKALANDQIKTLDSFGIASMAKYDGSLKQEAKEKVRNNIPNAIFTNPDTIHHSMLRTHDKWETYFKNLKFIVIDEIHLYKGYFGSNVSNIIYRLLSAVKKAGGDPQIVCTSATIENASKFAEELAHRPFDLFSSNSSGRAQREYNFMESERDVDKGFPLVDPRSILLYLITTQISQNKQAIVFIDSKAEINLITKYAKEYASKFSLNPDQVERYHADMDDEERVAVEDGLKNKKILVVFSTSALEIGIDIGSFDFCVLYGIPPFINQIWQRIGRVGRDPKSNVAVSIINRYSFRDQYYFNNPDYFFKTKYHQGTPIIFPKNDYLQELHQQCAFFEGMTKSETLAPTLWSKVAKSYNKGGAYLRIPIRKPWHDDYDLIDETTDKKIGEVEYERVYKDFHKNAVVLVNNKYYRCKSYIDYDTNTIPLYPVEDPQYYTRPIIDKLIAPDSNVSELIYEFGKEKIFIGESKVDIDLDVTAMRKFFFDGSFPKRNKVSSVSHREIRSHALWLSVKDEKFEVLHTLEHLIQRAIIELGYCDWSDIKGLTTTEFARYNAPALFIYEDMKIGTGMAQVFYDHILKIIQKAKDIVISCPCQDGCPQCIHSTNYCDLNDEFLNKQEAINFLNKLDFNNVSTKNFTPRAAFTTDNLAFYDRDHFDIGDTYADDWKVIDKTEDEYVIENANGDRIFKAYEDTPL